MKKTAIVMFLLTTMITGIQRVKGQSALENFKKKLSFGLKIEGNGSNFIIKDNSSLKSNAGAGAALGNFIRFNISEHFAIQEDIMFVYYTSDLSQNGIKDQFRYFGSEVPIYLMGQWKNAAGGRFFVGAGPYFGFGFSAKFKDANINAFKKYNGQTAMMKRLSNGAAANIGYELGNKLQINATYKYGLNSLDGDKDVYKLSPQSLAIGLGFTF
ncbi:MAG: porin family protein [Chitinophagaceae bacterium]